MRRWAATSAAVVLLVSAILHADLTVSQTITIEGAAAAFMGGNAAPRVVMQLKGTKVRTETEVMGQTTVVLTDLATKQTIVLNAADKTARIVDVATAPGADGNTDARDGCQLQADRVRSARSTPSPCDEYAIAMTIGMADIDAPRRDRRLRSCPDAAGREAGADRLRHGSRSPALASRNSRHSRRPPLEANMAATVSGDVGRGRSTGSITVMAATAPLRDFPISSRSR